MMNTLKFLAFVRFYIIYIFKARVKHYLSTDIVLFTQQLRKKIGLGKTYFKGTSILLKKRCKISAQNLIKNVDSSGSLRLLFDCASGRSRSTPEPVSKLSRRNLEAEPKASRQGVEVSLSSDFCLTNFAPTSAFHAVGLEFSSAVPLVLSEGHPKPTRRNTEQRWEKGRSWSGIGQIMVDYSLAQETHKLDYSATLGSTLLSRCYTQGRLNDCTRPTQQKQVLQNAYDLKQPHGVESQSPILSYFNSICTAFMSRVDTLLVSIDLVVHWALKCFGYLFGYKNSFRMSLPYLALVQSSNFSFKVLSIRAVALLALMVSMFSLSAQTPRKDSGADGLFDLERFPKIRYDVSDIEIQKLHIGDSLPASFWEIPIWLVYPDGKDEKKKLESFRDRKILVFDFWATWCAPCIASIDKFHQEAAVFDKRVAFIPVNIDFDYKALPFMQERKWKSPCMIGKSGMLIQKYFFDQAAAGGVVWIVDGIVRSIGYENERNIKNIPNILDGKDVKLTTYYK
ncbi:TlpA family protein disulfide reductase [Sphingobacterium siyangense]